MRADNDSDVDVDSAGAKKKKRNKNKQKKTNYKLKLNLARPINIGAPLCYRIIRAPSLLQHVATKSSRSACEKKKTLKKILAQFLPIQSKPTQSSYDNNRQKGFRSVKNY